MFIQRLAQRAQLQLRRWRRRHKGRDGLEVGLPHVEGKRAGGDGKGEQLAAWRAALALARPYFLGDDSRCRALAMSLALLVILMVESSVLIYYSSVQKEYMTALQEKNIEGFYGGLYKTGGLILLISPVIALHTILAGALKLDWRAVLTERFAQAYLAGSGESVFYRLQLTGAIDNPDQRICQDISDFVEVTFSLVQDTIGTVFGVVGFAGVMYRISPWVCFSVIIYALAGTLITTFGFGPFIMLYQNERIRQEAGLRYSLIRVRENAESVAFFKGGDAELMHFSDLFKKLTHTIYRAIMVNTGFSVFNRTFHWATFAVAPLTVGPAYLRGDVEFGSIAQANMAFNTILGGLTLIMNKMEALSNFAVRVRRLHALDVALQRERLRAKASQLSGAGATCIASVEIPANSPVVLQVQDMTLRTPPREACLQQTLAEHLSLQLSGGQTLLIAGDSGIGKSSLLRATAGLWTDGCGSVGLSGGGSAFFMPQKPYMFVGTLREQLLYPEVNRPGVNNATLEEALREVGLGYLLEQHSMWDCKEWSSLLSLGEQQRINFARVLLKKGVRLALLDEGTSACDPGNEARLYALLQQRIGSYVSVGHRPALQKHHSHVLWLQRPHDTAGRSANVHGPANISMLPMVEYQQALAKAQAELAASPSLL